MKPETFHSLNARVKRMAELYAQMERQPRRFEDGTELRSSEVHLLEMIGHQPGCSVTALAKYLGITKGAVSQTLRRLMGQGLVVKEVDEENLSRARVVLTTRGERFYAEHRAWHSARRDGGLLDLMGEITEEEGLFLHRSFDRFNAVLAEIIRLNK
jgi:DNA-binding MarR family transcriptional regulator